VGFGLMAAQPGPRFGKRGNRKLSSRAAYTFSISKRSTWQHWRGEEAQTEAAY
jgi:hypothetical protein